MAIKISVKYLLLCTLIALINPIAHADNRKHPSTNSSSLYNEIRCLQYAIVYFAPTNNINIYDLDTELETMEKKYGISYKGNIMAVSQKAAEFLQNEHNPSDEMVRNAVLRATKFHVARTGIAYAKAEGCSHDVAEEVAVRLEGQLNNRIRWQKISAKELSRNVAGIFKDYIGDNLKKEIKTILKDMNRRK